MADFVPVSGEAKVDDNASKGDVHFAAAEALLALSAAPTGIYS
jgi:hypothetical protein